MVKPIQTRWKGYQFRSRLEARWAVCFDSLGIDWSYEPEGFDLGEAGCYLPDFYMPTLDAWVEVKPGKLNVSERGKAFALSSATNKPVIELRDIPDPDKVRGTGCILANHYFGASMDRSKIGFYADDIIQFYSESNGIPWIESLQVELKDALAWDMSYYRGKHGNEHPNHFKEGMVKEFEVFHSRHLVDAICKARSARFEHGESP